MDDGFIVDPRESEESTHVKFCFEIWPELNRHHPFIHIME
jgi:hypothetical protein